MGNINELLCVGVNMFIFCCSISNVLVQQKVQCRITTAQFVTVNTSGEMMRYYFHLKAFRKSFCGFTNQRGSVKEVPTRTAQKEN